MNSRGFTLIELLVVIGLIGVLAGVVLVVIDPTEQFEKGRDAQRKSTVGQLSKAMQAYYTFQGAYPLPTTMPPVPTPAWITNLVTAGEIKAVPPSVSNSTSCLVDASGASVTAPNSREENNFCYYYQASGNPLVWTLLKSKSEKNKCTNVTLPYPVFYWSGANNQSGIQCVNHPYNAQLNVTPIP